MAEEGYLATYLEGLDLSQGGSVRIGLVLFGTTEEGAHTILPLTPYDENHLDAITDAFEKAEAAHANEGSANLEAAIARADQMLDDAFAETGGSGDYQTLAIVSDGMTTSWGVDEQQTFNYDYAGGTNEPTDDFLRGHVQRILDLLSHCYIDTDGDGTKEKFDGGSTDEPGTYDPLQWMNDNATKIEQDIKDYANKTISTDEASNVTTSLEAGGYRAACLLRSLLTSDGTDGQRKYLVVFDQQAEAYSYDEEDILFGVRCGLMNCLVYGGP